MTIEVETTPPPGWYARLVGEQFDLDEWCYQLKRPFDPAVVRTSNDETLLASSEFEGLCSANEVRERALVLSKRLNGALLLSQDTRPLQVDGIVRVAEDGKVHRIMYADVAEFTSARARVTATVTRADGSVITPPLVKSEAQLWNELAQTNDLISDLLDHFGRADNWYDIYKTLEFCKLVAGSKRNLSKLLGSNSSAVEAMRRSANYYRHAREKRPVHLHTLDEAKPLLSHAVRSTIAYATERAR